MLLGADELLDIIKKGYLNALVENINAASVDVRIGDIVLLEEEIHKDTLPCIDLQAKENIKWREVKIPEEGLIIPPGTFFLAHTIEEFNLPDNLSAQFILRSSVARAGLNHLMAGWADAGFHGSKLTLELHNVTKSHNLIIKSGMRIGQMIFYRHAPAGNNSYALKGRYNNSNSVVAGKGV